MDGTEIGDYAFSENTALTEITLSGDVVSIGQHAFDGCTVALIELDAATSDVGASGNPTLVSILDESRLATLFARSLV